MSSDNATLVSDTLCRGDLTSIVPDERHDSCGMGCGQKHPNTARNSLAPRPTTPTPLCVPRQVKINSTTHNQSKPVGTSNSGKTRGNGFNKHQEWTRDINNAGIIYVLFYRRPADGSMWYNFKANFIYIISPPNLTRLNYNLNEKVTYFGFETKKRQL